MNFLKNSKFLLAFFVSAILAGHVLAMDNNNKKRTHEELEEENRQEREKQQKLIEESSSEVIKSTIQSKKILDQEALLHANKNQETKNILISQNCEVILCSCDGLEIQIPVKAAFSSVLLGEMIVEAMQTDTHKVIKITLQNITGEILTHMVQFMYSAVSPESASLILDKLNQIDELQKLKDILMAAFYLDMSVVTDFTVYAIIRDWKKKKFAHCDHYEALPRALAQKILDVTRDEHGVTKVENYLQKFHPRLPKEEMIQLLEEMNDHCDGLRVVGAFNCLLCQEMSSSLDDMRIGVLLFGVSLLGDLHTILDHYEESGLLKELLNQEYTLTNGDQTLLGTEKVNGGFWVLCMVLDANDISKMQWCLEILQKYDCLDKALNNDMILINILKKNIEIAKMLIDYGAPITEKIIEAVDQEIKNFLVQKLIEQNKKLRETVQQLNNQIEKK